MAEALPAGRYRPHGINEFHSHLRALFIHCLWLGAGPLGTGHADPDVPGMAGAVATTSCIQCLVVEAFPLRACGMDLALFHVRQCTANTASQLKSSIRSDPAELSGELSDWRGFLHACECLLVAESGLSDDSLSRYLNDRFW